MQDALKILIVEDDEVDRLAVIRVLKKYSANISITESASASETFDALKNDHFDCLLLDYGLPDCEGLELLQKVHKYAPVVVLTGREDDELASTMIKHGAQDYLVKGQVSASLLYRTIHYAIDRKKSADILYETSNKFRSMFEVASDLIFILDNKHIITEVNPRVHKKLGLQKNKILGHNITDLLTLESKEYFILQLSTLLGNTSQRQELELQCGNNTTLPVDSSLSTVTDNQGTLISIIVSMRDITHQKDAEEQLRIGKDSAESVNRQMQSELEIAREIQNCLYPKNLPEMKGVKIIADLHQARYIGGDYYDIIPINDHTIAFLIVDVAGHDVAAAFVVGMAKISFSAHIPVYPSLIDIYNHVNKDMVNAIKEERYLSAFLAIYNSQTQTLKYAKAGHFDQCLYRAKTKKLEILKTEGMFIGAFNDGQFQEASCQIESDDRLFLYTDGLFEIRNPQDELYGEKRLYTLFELIGHNPIKELHEQILTTTRQFAEGTKPNDDTCLLISEFEESPIQTQIKSLFGDKTPSIPPVLLNSKKDSDETVSNMLVLFDDFFYTDELIRHYKKIFHVIVNAFQIHESANYCSLRLVGDITVSHFRLVLVLDSTTHKSLDFFTTGICRDILMRFNKNFGSIDLNETGNRIIFNYKKSSDIESQTKDITFETMDDGIYLTVPINLDSLRTIDSIINDLTQKNIVNIPIQEIENLLELKSGKPVKISDAFSHYDEKKNKLFKLSETPLEAILSLLDVPSIDESLTKEDIEYILRSKEISYGILSNVIEEIVKSGKIGYEYCIAKGKPQEDGEDAKIIECIKIDSTLSPLIKEDGSVDHKVLDLMETISKNTIILKKIPRKQGIAGTSIYKRTIDPKEGEEKYLVPGENTVISDDGLHLFAKKDGFLYRNKNAINVKQLFHVASNVDYSTGNINYAGDIYISGNILSGFKVESENNICINGEIEASEILSTNGSITCRKGVFGKNKASVSAGNNINAEFIQEASITCSNDLTVNKNLMNVKATIGKNVFVGIKKEGSIIGGEFICTGSIHTPEIGNKQMVKTIIKMEKKVNLELRQKLTKSHKHKEELQYSYSSLKNQLQMRSKLFKIKSKKTVKEKEEIEKLLKTYYPLKQNLEKLNILISKLKEEEEKENSFGEICVSKNIYPNVELHFGKLIRKISSKIGPVIFIIDGNEIVIRPYKEEILLP